MHNLENTSSLNSASYNSTQNALTCIRYVVTLISLRLTSVFCWTTKISILVSCTIRSLRCAGLSSCLMPWSMCTTVDSMTTPPHYWNYSSSLGQLSRGESQFQVYLCCISHSQSLCAHFTFLYRRVYEDWPHSACIHQVRKVVLCSHGTQGILGVCCDVIGAVLLVLLTPLGWSPRITWWLPRLQWVATSIVRIQYVQSLFCRCMKYYWLRLTHTTLTTRHLTLMSALCFSLTRESFSMSLLWYIYVLNSAWLAFMETHHPLLQAFEEPDFDAVLSE